MLELLARGSDRVVTPDRPGRDRQEPPRDRGRDRGARPVPRRHVLRRPRERARARRCCSPRSPTPSASATTAKPRSKSASRSPSPAGACCIVLDNFEQIVDAAPVLVRLYTLAPIASFLVTSRIVLRIRGERVYEVPPLDGAGCPAPPATLRARSAVRRAVELFVERARAVKPDFALTQENTARGRGRSAGGSTGCRSRSSWPPRRMRLLTPAGIAAAARAAACRLLVDASARPPGAAAHDARDDRVDRRAASPRTSGDCCEDLGVFAARLHARGGRGDRGRTRRGTGARSTGSRRWSTARSSSRPRSTATRSSRCSRPCANTRSGGSRSAARRDVMRAAHADYYIDARARAIAPELRGRGPGSRRSARSASSARTCAQRSATSSTPIASTTPPTSRGGCSSTGGLAGFFDEVGVWMLELLGKDAADHAARPRGRAVLRPVGRDVAATVALRSSPASASACGLFAESGDEDAAAMALAARSGLAQMHAAGSPTSTPPARARAMRVERLRALGDALGRGDRAHLARPRRVAAWRAGRGARALRAALASGRGGRRSVHADGRAAPPARSPAAGRRRGRMPPSPWLPAHADAHLGDAATTTRASRTPSRACAPSRPPAGDAERRRDAGGRCRGDQAADQRCSTRRQFVYHSVSLDAVRTTTADDVAAGERAGARADCRRGAWRSRCPRRARGRDAIVAHGEPRSSLRRRAAQLGRARGGTGCGCPAGPGRAGRARHPSPPR